jgi:hypothetical protein
MNVVQNGVALDRDPAFCNCSGRSWPNAKNDVPFDLNSLPDTPDRPNDPTAPTAPASPNQAFWEHHDQRTENADGSVTITPRTSYDAPDAYVLPDAQDGRPGR